MFEPMGPEWAGLAWLAGVAQVTGEFALLVWPGPLA